MAQDQIFDIFRDLIARLDTLSESVDEKLTSSVSELKADLRHLTDMVETRISRLEEHIADHEKRIASHDQYFKIGGWVVTGGLAGVLGWVFELFGKFLK